LLRRRSGWVLLALVTLVHVLAVDELADDRFGWGAGEQAGPRIEVAFVRELEQAAAPVAAVAPKPPPVARRALPSLAPKPAVPASAPQPSQTRMAEAPPPPPPVPAPPAPPVAVVAEAPAPIAPPVELMPPLPEPSPPPAEPVRSAEPPRPVASAAQAEAFDWPPSTRLTYSLSGYYRGPIEGGHAQVEWLRAGSRYQVRMESSVGPMFSRRVASEGELTERGLAPTRFDGEQKLAFGRPKRWTQLFSRERITFDNGTDMEALAGVQDEASQFVQLTWLFTTQPSLLQVGNSIEMPLAINRRADRWIYDVKEKETLNMPFGAVPTFHVKPRREAKGGDMVVEIWFAPTLQYLPVRMIVRQSDSAFMELNLIKPPLQAAK
jgi:hypothetical protein